MALVPKAHNAVIAYPDWSDAATITEANEAGATPAVNLQAQQPTTVWRSSDLATPHVVMDLGADAPARLAALLFTNISATGSWRWRMAATEADLTDGDAVLDSAGAFGMGYRFSGAVGVSAFSTTASDGLTTWTVEANVLFDAARRQNILTWTGDTTILRLSMNTNGTLFVSDGSTFTLTTTKAWAVDEMAFVSLVYDAGSELLSFYVDGDLIGTQSIASGLTGAALTFSGNDVSHLQGMINEARLWSTARTEGQIDAARLAPLGGGESGLHAYWPMNEGTGTTMADGSGNGRALTLLDDTGAPGWGFPSLFWAGSDWSTHAGGASSWIWDAVGVTARWARIDIHDHLNADGFVQAGRLCIASAYQPTLNFPYGSSPFGVLDDSRRVTLPGGQTRVTQRPARKTMRFRVVAQDALELEDALYDIMRLRGAAKDVLVLFDPRPHRNRRLRWIYGLLQQRQEVTSENFSLHEVQLAVEAHR